MSMGFFYPCGIYRTHGPTVRGSTSAGSRGGKQFFAPRGRRNVATDGTEAKVVALRERSWSQADTLFSCPAWGYETGRA